MLSCLSHSHRHPLHARGVDIYGAFEVRDSSWIRELRQIAGSRIEGRHFILTFHDITFEWFYSRSHDPVIRAPFSR
jgi:hypothetical protein